MAKRRPTVKKSSKSARPTKDRAKPEPRSAAASGRSKGDRGIEVIARGFWLHGSQALLCRNLDKGYYYLPGGHVEFGESAAGGLAREFLEEAGLKVRVGPLRLATEAAFETRKRWHHEINLVFHVEPMSGRVGEADRPPLVTSLEKSIGFEWVDLAAAVDLDIRPLAVKAWLAAGAGVDPSAARAEWVSEIPG